MGYIMQVVKGDMSDGGDASFRYEMVLPRVPLDRSNSSKNDDPTFLDKQVKMAPNVDSTLV
jgi:hypothetical protein